MALDCEGIVKGFLKRGLTDEEIEDFFAQAKKLHQGLKARGAAANGRQAVLAASASWGRRQQLLAYAKKRATALQQVKRSFAIDYCLEKFKGHEGEGLIALLAGSQRAIEGARLSADGIARGLEGFYLGGFINDLRQLGPDAFAVFRKGWLDREVAAALWQLDNPNAGKWTGSPLAMNIAKVAHKWSERARLDANKAGAWIGKLPGYIVRQSHDGARIHKAGLDAWRDYIRERIDWDRTIEGKLAGDVDGQNQFLARLYNAFVTGVHQKQTGGNVNPLAKAANTGSVAARMSASRVLHFKDGGAWFDYNRRFGFGNLRESLLRGYSMSARNTGLMRVLGPSPQANVEQIYSGVRQALAKRGDVAGVERLAGMKKAIKNQLAELDGSGALDGNPTLASIGKYARLDENVSKLGGVLLSSFSDIPTFAFEFAYHGKSFFKSLTGGITSAMQGRGSVEQQRILASLGVFYDTMSGELAARFLGSRLPEKITAAQNLFFRLNGLGWWTDVWKKACGLMLSHDLAQDAGLAFARLDPRRQRVLKLYGIDQGLWDMLRKGRLDAADGRKYLTPEIARDLGEAEITSYLKARGRQVTPGMVAQFRDEAEEKLRTYFRDRVQYAVLEPDARTRAILYQGNAAGTPVGEVLRCVMQFKSFPTAFLQRIVGREIYGRGDAGLGQGLLHAFLKNQHGEANNLAAIFIALTVFGYGSMTAKQLAAGRTPRDPADPKVWLAAAAQGGGLGIYGDFLLGEKSRMGSSFFSSLAGPAGTSLEGVYNLYQNIKEGTDVRAEAFRLFFNHMPGNNLFWFRTAFDHLIANQFYEHVNPGWIARMRRRIKRENNQDFWLTPKKL